VDTEAGSSLEPPRRTQDARRR